MVQDFVHIRRGTSPEHAFRKTMKILWDYILYNSKNLKTEKKIQIRFSGGEW